MKKLSLDMKSMDRIVGQTNCIKLK